MRSAILLSFLLLGLLSLSRGAELQDVGLQNAVFPFIRKPRLPAVCNAILESVINNTPGMVFTPKSIAGSVKPTCLKFVSPEAKKQNVSPNKVLDSCELFFRVLEDSLSTAFKEPKVAKVAKKNPKKVAKRFCGYFAALDSHVGSASVLDYLPADDKKAMCLAIVAAGADERERKFTCESELNRALKEAVLPLDSVPSACEGFVKLMRESEATGTFGEGGESFCGRIRDDESVWHAPFSAGEPNLYAFFDPLDPEDDADLLDDTPEDAPAAAEQPHVPEHQAAAHAHHEATAPHHEEQSTMISAAAFSDRVVHAFRSVTDAFWAMGGDPATGMMGPEKFTAVCLEKLELPAADCKAMFNHLDFSAEGAGDGQVSLKEWLDALGMDVSDLRARIGMVVGGVDAVFKEGDADADGQLTDQEFVKTVTAQPLDISEVNAHHLFEKLDPNHDGKLSQSEFTDRLGVTLKEMMHRIYHRYGTLTAAFRDIDTNGGLETGDGVISEAELAKLFDALQVPQEDRAKLTRLMDQDGDGQVTVGELVKAFPVDGEELRYRIYENAQVKNPADAFDQMDVKKDERLDKPEFEKGVEPYNVTKTDADRIFDKADDDHDSKMDREEFYNAVGYLDGLSPKEAEAVKAAAARKRRERVQYGQVHPWGGCADGSCQPGIVPAELASARRAKRARTTTTPQPSEAIRSAGAGQGQEGVPEAVVALATVSSH